ncbi:MAG: hypothetical protein Q7T01_02585 [bacterium]|nr:hypothetical protein [bacterium]
MHEATRQYLSIMMVATIGATVVTCATAQDELRQQEQTGTAQQGVEAPCTVERARELHPAYSKLMEDEIENGRARMSATVARLQAAAEQAKRLYIPAEIPVPMIHGWLLEARDFPDTHMDVDRGPSGWDCLPGITPGTQQILYARTLGGEVQDPHFVWADVIALATSDFRERVRQYRTNQSDLNGAYNAYRFVVHPLTLLPHAVTRSIAYAAITLADHNIDAAIAFVDAVFPFVQEQLGTDVNLLREIIAQYAQTAVLGTDFEAINRERLIEERRAGYWGEAWTPTGVWLRIWLSTAEHPYARVARLHYLMLRVLAQLGDPRVVEWAKPYVELKNHHAE